MRYIPRTRSLSILTLILCDIAAVAGGQLRAI